MNSTFDARFQLKRDTQEAWERNDPVLLNGELVIVDFPDGKHRTKTGDGSSRYKALPFDGGTTYSKAVDVTLSSGAWAGKEQRIPVPGLKDGGNGMVSIRSSASTQQIDASAAAHLRIARQEDGFMTIAADGDVPSVDIPLSVVILAAADASSVINVELLASGWSVGKQTVAVPGVTADTNGAASVADSATAEQVQAARMAQVRVFSQSGGSMVFAASGDMPKVNIPISILILSEEG